ncbi:MAG: hypothetical protein EBT89_08030 [Opitutaceae bacterium]|nr:hypothetical protein [Opitutaceae bacterium]
MNNIDLQDYLPWIVCATIWLALVPVRLVVLMLLPANASYIFHPCNNLWRRVKFESNLWS